MPISIPCEHQIRAKFKESDLPTLPAGEDTAIIPTVKGSVFLRYGKHAYYFYDFEAQKCVCVEIPHRDIIAPGMALFFQSLDRKNTLWSKFKLLQERFHYGFSFIEQIMLMTVPHCITSLGGGRFLVNLWSYVGYVEIDCSARTAKYLRRTGQDKDAVLGSQQWVSRRSGETYYITYSLPESLRKITDARRPVPCKIMKENPADGSTSVVWSGELSDYLHDILINETGQYCVVCELGMFQNEANQTIPSKVLILDMNSGNQWIIEKFIVAAHAQFDPVEPDVIYFSNHNFKFIPGTFLQLLREATYALEFTGPASVYKYRLTTDGPVELGVFTDPEMFRLTNFHVFMHRGKRVIAAMGFPNFIYIASADTMQIIRRISVRNRKSWKHLFREPPCFVGTFSPSADGENLYVQTTRSFQVIRVEDGRPLGGVPLFFNHTAPNHMQTVASEV
ncbi:MAG: hypothetical protein WC701_11315 [Kiritimatiellales bacterium]|jgi:hypothetical protein